MCSKPGPGPSTWAFRVEGGNERHPGRANGTRPEPALSLPVLLLQSCLYFTGIVARSWSRPCLVRHAVTPGHRSRGEAASVGAIAGGAPPYGGGLIPGPRRDSGPDIGRATAPDVRGRPAGPLAPAPTAVGW